MNPLKKAVAAFFSLGVAALAAAYPRAFDLLRYAGAAYLAWIGFTLIRDAKQTLGKGKVATGVGRGPWHWFREAMLVTLGKAGPRLAPGGKFAGTVAYLGSPDWGVIVSTYIGSILMA